MQIQAQHIKLASTETNQLLLASNQGLLKISFWDKALHTRIIIGCYYYSISSCHPWWYIHYQHRPRVWKQERVHLSYLLSTAVFHTSLISDPVRKRPTRWHCGRLSTSRCPGFVSKIFLPFFWQALSFSLCFSCLTGFSSLSLLLDG